MNKPENQNDQLDQLKAKLYQVKNNDPFYQAAIKIIKYQSRQIGAFKAWNNRYRNQNNVPNNVDKIKKELDSNKHLLARQVRQTQELLQEREQILQELKQFDQRVKKLQIAYEQAENSGGLSLWQRIQGVMLAVKELLSPPEEINSNHQKKVITTQIQDSDAFADKPQMKCDQASINRSLLDR
jgi:hypothetical protein